MADIASLPEYVGWYSEPDVRGTGSLLWTCISTILVCTWSALHLNVPKSGISKWGSFARKLRYLALALLAPETIASVACQDWDHSCIMTKKMSSHKTPNEWNQTLSMFIIMGGIAIPDNNGGTIRLPPDYLPIGFESGWWDLQDISSQAVEDKSKANYFTKGITSIQILWFLSQLIGRLATKLPITTLELFTLAYISCAVFAYAFWINKPFDVETPFLIQTNAAFTADCAQAIKSNTEYTQAFLRGEGFISASINGGEYRDAYTV
ncbi:hypothetical protein B0J11DRAFT_575325 [Dendryphion nanum]|uniref:Uncharacterized protein n=1 Tax=Dendryphion nanum TaxID=256645 RepID=A0A9P9IXK9_9PLEO|nr:hypothetical protein B0J11DRAFT_575325 [Dendryphion nanum]